MYFLHTSVKARNVWQTIPPKKHWKETHNFTKLNVKGVLLYTPLLSFVCHRPHVPFVCDEDASLAFGFSVSTSKGCDSSIVSFYPWKQVMTLHQKFAVKLLLFSVHSVKWHVDGTNMQTQTQDGQKCFTHELTHTKQKKLRSQATDYRKLQKTQTI